MALSSEQIKEYLLGARLQRSQEHQHQRIRHQKGIQYGILSAWIQRELSNLDKTVQRVNYQAEKARRTGDEDYCKNPQGIKFRFHGGG